MSTAIASDFATNLQARFLQIAAEHPRLLDAVAPEPIERRDGQFSLNVAAFWEDFCSREWQPRAGRDQDLIGPFHLYGECLSPFTRVGELHWYDPTIPARDGDVVLVQWDPSVIEQMYTRNGSDSDWVRQYGEPAPVATKVYKTVGTSQYLLTRKSATPLGQNRILGVLRKRLGAPASHAIEPFAATEAYQVSDLPETSYGLGTHYVVDGSFSPAHDGIVELAASYDYRGLAVDGIGNNMTRALFVLQSASYQYGVVAQNGAGNSTYISQSHSDFFNVVGGALVTFGLLLSNSSGLESMRIRNARMKAGFIKR